MQFTVRFFIGNVLIDIAATYIYEFSVFVYKLFMYYICIFFMHVSKLVLAQLQCEIKILLHFCVKISQYIIYKLNIKAKIYV